jgi:hypothetical protein
MKKYDLKGEDVARRLGVTTRRVYGWLSVGQTTPIPTTKLQLLELLLHREDMQPAWEILSHREPAPKKKRVRKTKKRTKVRKAK